MGSPACRQSRHATVGGFLPWGCIIKKGGAQVATPLAKHRQVSCVMLFAALPAHLTSSFRVPAAADALILTSTLHPPSTARRSPGARVSAARRGCDLRPLKLGHRRRRRHGGGCRLMAAAGTFLMSRVAQAIVARLMLRGATPIRVSASRLTRRRHGKPAQRPQSRGDAASLAVSARSAPRQPTLRSAACWEARPSR